MSLNLEAFAAWAIEVDPAQLEAHLEAYADALSTILALRTANRFGGTAPITNLPREIVKMVEDCLLQVEQANRLREWRRRARCALWATNIPDLQDVVGHSQIEALQEPLASPELQVCPHWQNTIETILREHELANICCAKFENAFYELQDGDLLDAAYVSHQKEQEDWHDRVLSGQLYSQESQKLLRDCFGLEVWPTLSHAMIVHGRKILNTQTYLIKCGLSQPHSRCGLGEEDQEGNGFQMWVQNCTRFTEASTLNQQDRQRFGRVVEQLGIQPISGPSSFGATIPLADGERQQEAKRVTDWPVLMVMSRAGADYDGW